MKSIIIVVVIIIFVLLSLPGPFFKNGITFTQKNYLFKMKGAHKDYFTEDCSKANRHEIVDYSSCVKDSKIQEILYAFLNNDLLKYCDNKIILGYKDEKVVSVGYPNRFYNYHCTGEPITIPIFVKNIESIGYKFIDINN